MGMSALIQCGEIQNDNAGSRMDQRPWRWPFLETVLYQRIRLGIISIPPRQEILWSYRIYRFISSNFVNIDKIGNMPVFAVYKKSSSKTGR